jgi:carbon monoxide dehydrogenase subunit G
MELKGERLIAAPLATTWAALNDPDTLKACIAGCESLERTGPDSFAAVVALKIGPVSARFRGNLRMTAVSPPNGYTIHFDGQGGAAGFGKGSADVKLAAEGDAATRLAYHARATVGGKMAQIGSRLVDATAAKITDDFFKAFEAQVRAEAPGGAQAQDGAEPPGSERPVGAQPVARAGQAGAEPLGGDGRVAAAKPGVRAPLGTMDWVLAGLVVLATAYFVLR